MLEDCSYTCTVMHLEMHTIRFQVADQPFPNFESLFLEECVLHEHDCMLLQTAPWHQPGLGTFDLK